MAINEVSPTTFTSGVLIADTVETTGGSNDSISSLTQVAGVPVDASLEIQSTEGGLLIPRMTTAQRDALTTTGGMLIFNSTTGLFDMYLTGGWSTIGSGGGSVTSVGTGTGLTGGPITITGTISLADTAVTPGSYTFSSLTVDQQGRLTAASSGTAVTSVGTGTGLTGGPITSTGTVSLADTAVTPGSYTSANITVDQQGRLTAAASGGGGASTLDAVLTAGNDANNQSIVGLSTLSFGIPATPVGITVSIDGATATAFASSSIAVGSGAAAGTDGISLGRSAGTSLSGADFNIAIGLNALNSITTSAADNNIAIGQNAATAVTTGHSNVCVGNAAGGGNTVGTSNVFIGPLAGSEGSANVCIGLSSGSGLDAAADNTIAIGDTAAAGGGGNITGNDNICIGRSTDVDITANGCIAIGQGAHAALNGVTIGISAGTRSDLAAGNIAIGTDALDASVTGDLDNNVAIGFESGTNVTEGDGNTLVGYRSGDTLTTGSTNICIGFDSDCGATATSGVAIGNTAVAGIDGISIGRSAGAFISGADFNIAIGLNALNSITTSAADNNVCIGQNAGTAITTGGSNVCVGNSAGGGNTVGTSNVSIGPLAAGRGSSDICIGLSAGSGLATTADNIIAIGNTAAAGGAGNIEGDDHICIGRSTDVDITASGCIAIGQGAHAALNGVTIGVSAGTSSELATGNIAIGTDALDESVTGDTDNNVAIGFQAGTNIVEGDGNTLLGYRAGDTLTSGSSNTAIGSDADCAATADNQTALGNGTVTTGANQVFLGNTSVTTISGQVAFTTYSDARFKHNILDLNLGLDFVNKLSPKTYNVKTLAVQEFRAKRYDKRDEIVAEFEERRKSEIFNDDVDKEEKLKQINIEEELALKKHDKAYDPALYSDSEKKTWCGLIAQDVQNVLKDLNSDNLDIVDVPEDDSKEVYGIRYTTLIPVLINAIKELSAKVDVLQGARN